MFDRHLCSALRGVLPLVLVTLLLPISACYEDEMASKGGAAVSSSTAAPASVKSLPKRGKQRLAAAPAYAVFGMIYINTTNNREYIYDGAQWVPHDQTVEDYYKAMDSKRAMLPASEVFPTGPPLPAPTGAHGKHAIFVCKTCHVVGGVFSFDPAGPAVAPSPNPLPSFQPSPDFTCSSVACHGMYAGTFSWYFPGGDGEPELHTVNYAGSGGSAPSWYSTGLGCTACHGNPPPNGAWHSGNHGGQGPTGARNQCQLCHPDASSPNNGIGNTITNPALHGNGTVNVQARFTSACFGCH